MKKIASLIILLNVSFAAFSQKVNYKVTEDIPKETSNLNINIEFAQVDLNTKIIDATSLNFSLWGYYDILKDKIQLEFLIRKSWLTFARISNQNLPSNLDINSGANLFLKNNTKSKSIKVVLDSKFYSGVTYDVTEIKYLEVPGSVYTRKGLRGGLYFKQVPYIIDYDDLISGIGYGTDLEGKLNSFGFYLGVINSRSVNLFIQSDQYGKSYSSVGTNLYFDLLIIPVNNFTSSITGNSDNATVQSYWGKNPLGFRLGYKLFQIAPKSKTGRKFGTSGAAEIGYKPYLGWFVNASMGITIVK
jgi:hypothetical protein